MLSAIFGIYSIPFLRRIRPVYHKTSMSCVIANCGVILLLSSALPVLSRILGITSFDLLSSYANITWISNFTLVWSYNILFAVASAFSLLNKFTAQVRIELRKRWVNLFEKSI